MIGAPRYAGQPTTALQPVEFGGQQAAERLNNPETPAWMKSVAPPTVGPGMPLSAAQNLWNQGVPSRQVFYQTGWFRDAAGNPLWVLPDRNASLNRNRFDVTPAQPEKVVTPAVTVNGHHYDAITDPAEPEKLTLRPGEYKLPEVLKHPDLYQAYPKLGQATIQIIPPEMGGHGFSAAYDTKNNKVYVGPGQSEELMTESVLHELMHGIQGEEHLPPGGDWHMFVPGDYYTRRIAALNGRDAARDAVAGKLPQGEDAENFMNLLDMKINNNDKDPIVQSGVDRIRKLLPADVYDDAVKAVAGLYPTQVEQEEAEKKYYRLTGENQAYQVAAEHNQQNWDQYPPDIKQTVEGRPDLVPPEQQLIYDPNNIGRLPLRTTPGQSYEIPEPPPMETGGALQPPPPGTTQVEHDPFAASSTPPINLTPVDGDPFKKSPPGTPMTLTPVDQDPFAGMPNTTLPTQPQMPVPAMSPVSLPSQPSTALDMNPTSQYSNQTPMPWAQPTVAPVNTVTQ